MSNQDQALREALRQAGRNLSAATIAFHRTVASRLGLNDTDHKCLDLLMREGPMTAGRLSELTGYTTGAVTGVLDRLQRAGYVARTQDPEDRRRVIVRPKAHKVGARIGPLLKPMIEMMEALNQHYSDQELRIVLKYLEQTAGVLTEAASSLRDEATARR